jgi:hypothetical protein
MFRGSAFITLPAILLAMIHSAIAQTVARAYAGDDKKVHVIYANARHRSQLVPAEQQQVGCESVSVAPDKRTIGWSVLVENCCTSYPIATAIVLYRDGRKRVIYSDQMIYEWHFRDHGDRVSVLSGPTHGYAAQANLYETRSGKLVASWDGKGPAPKWAKGWEEQFQH